MAPCSARRTTFTLCLELVPYAIERYRNEAHRPVTVLDNQLAGRDYVAGDYSIADMALYPRATRHEMAGD